MYILLLPLIISVRFLFILRKFAVLLSFRGLYFIPLDVSLLNVLSCFPYLWRKTAVPLYLCVKLVSHLSLNVLFLRMPSCFLYLKQIYFCHLLPLLPQINFCCLFPETFLPFHFPYVLFPYILPLSRGNPDFCQEKGRRLCLTASSWEGASWDPPRQSVRASSEMLREGQWVFATSRGSLGCVASIIIWSLIVSNHEEINLTSRLRTHKPKISRIIIATRGHSRGKNQISYGSQDLISPHTCATTCIVIVPLPI
jgi:hypothetical protein